MDFDNPQRLVYIECFADNTGRLDYGEITLVRHVKARTSVPYS